MKTNSILLAVAIVAIIAACTNTHGTEPANSVAAKTDSVAAPDYAKIIAAKIYIKPEKVNDFTTMFKGMTDSTLKEPGCTSYQLYQNPYDKNSFFVYETYKNKAAIDAHFASSYFKSFGDKVAPLTSKPTEIVIYDIAGETKK